MSYRKFKQHGQVQTASQCQSSKQHSSAIPQLSVLLAGPRVVASAKKLDKEKICKERFCAWGKGRNLEKKRVFLSLKS